MNIHHLELFYYVARFKGITEAVRNIPYGIQQPAVSGQVAQLEEHLGVVLFNRRPFSLTPAGEKLYKFIHPFFSNLDAVATDIQGGRASHIRIGASTIVLRDHLPKLYHNVRRKHPGLRISLREGYQMELESLLQRDEIDLAVTLIEKHATPGINSEILLDLPMALLAHKSLGLSSAEQLWQRDSIQEALICLPEPETICKHFQQGLSRIGVDWFPGIEVSSIDLIEVYANAGFGIGLTVLVPGAKLPPDIVALTLPASPFSPVHVGVMWRGKVSPLAQAFIDELDAAARRLGK